jgi:hypothetical protein
MMSDTNEFRKSVTKNGVTKSLCIKEVENGYVINIEKYGDVEGDYINEKKTYISATNPMEKEEKLEQQEESGILEAIGALGI